MTSPPNQTETGRVWFRSALSIAECEALAAATVHKGMPGGRIRVTPELDRLIGTGSTLGRIARTHASGARAVRVLAFDKTESLNWALPWHQDRVIAVAERRDIPGFTNWTCKGGVWHVEPPVELLERMFFSRVHLDDTDTENGCMDIALGSHRHGLVPSHRAAELASAFPLEACIAQRGDILLVNALTLHRSGPSTSSRPRRTLRIDFSVDNLPSPLEWAL